MTSTSSQQNWQRLICAGFIMLSFTTTGCQVDIGGQTLPSPYYIYDDIQYFAPGQEFKLSNEADAMKAYKAENELGGAAN